MLKSRPAHYSSQSPRQPFRLSTMSTAFIVSSGRLSLRSRLPHGTKLLPQLSRYCCRPVSRTTSTFLALQSRTRPICRQPFSCTPAPRTAAIPKGGESPLGALADSLARPGANKALGLSWPEISDKKVGYWLLGSAALVFGIVVLGGLTRLTESGFVSPSK